MKRALFVLLVVDLLLALSVYLWKGDTWLTNSQIAFFSSSLIMFASMLSYQGMVQGRLNVGAIPDDERDTLDKLEDPYDLYDESKIVEEEKTLVEVVEEERANLKQGRSIWEATKDAKASFTFYRLGAYVLLVLGFFYLNNNKLLELTPYLVFLSIPPIIIVLVLMQNKAEK